MKYIKTKIALLGITCAAGVALAQVAEPGPFKPNWSSLQNYQTPDWFRDAKFGIWAHWGPQCEPENGDWYARHMYEQGNFHYEFHNKNYGHPSAFGFKDVINLWKAAEFNPDALLAIYKKSGAQYFVALANHHDNLDLWDSKYQSWNSVKVGPKKDLIGGWAAAAKKTGLRFGVSVHAARTWSWYAPAQGADKQGPLAGVPYDGKLTKADGKGKWWEGLDPQELYEQNHGPNTPPDRAYIDKFFKRTRQLIEDYKPDLVYFDDSVLPLYKFDEAAGLNLVADFYNDSVRFHGDNQAVINTKSLNTDQRKAVVYDIERGKAAEILPQPWQTDTCIGDWHYARRTYENDKYKTAATVIPMLVDIVSKNGNLLLSVPLRRNGMPDEKELAIIGDIGAWLNINGEAIYATRPWTIYGEGPSILAVEAGKYGGQKDAHSQPLTAADIRFTQSKDGKVIYAIVLAIPVDHKITIKSFALPAPGGRSFSRASVVGTNEELQFGQDDAGLHLTLPSLPSAKIAIALRFN